MDCPRVLAVSPRYDGRMVGGGQLGRGENSGIRAVLNVEAPVGLN